MRLRSPLRATAGRCRCASRCANCAAACAASVFIACIALGVMAIAGVGSFAESLAKGSRAKAAPFSAATSLSRWSTGGERSRTRVPDGTARFPRRDHARDGAHRRRRNALVEIKAVDAPIPLRRGRSRSAGALARAGAAQRHYGAVADALVRAARSQGRRAHRRSAKRIEIARASQSRARQARRRHRLRPASPDQRCGSARTGLLQPGSLVRWNYRLRLPATTRAIAPRRRCRSVGAQFPKPAGRSARAPMPRRSSSATSNASPNFLTLVGLTALLVGGVGVANAVKGHLERRREVIATMKALGATGGRVFALYLVEMMAAGRHRHRVGLALGAALPFPIVWRFGAISRFRSIRRCIRASSRCGAYGLLTALAFALWPLGRAHDMPVSALFRDGSLRSAVAALALHRRDRRRDRVLAASPSSRLGARSPRFRRGGGRRVLLLRSWRAVMAIARALPRPRSTNVRLAIANIHRPGALTPSVVLSLGLGLALLVTDHPDRRQSAPSVPRGAARPARRLLFPRHPEGRSRALRRLRPHARAGRRLERVPMMRGRIVSGERRRQRR